jgi:NAD-dependent deacetylase
MNYYWGMIVKIMNKKLIYEAGEFLKKAKYPIVLSGAGVSADSGIPTFRNSDSLSTKASYFGYYKNFINDPKLWWEDQLDTNKNEQRTKFRNSVEQAIPNPSHYAIAELELNNIIKHVITQNVDELHYRAGSKNVIEIHGSRYKCRCVECEKRFSRELMDISILPPICECGGIIKFDTVLFGEAIPRSVLKNCIDVVSKSDFILVVGTSSLVNPSANFPKYIKKNGGMIVEANINTTPISSIAKITLRGSTSNILPILSDYILKKN